MILFVQILFACSLFHQAYCCFSKAFPQTKEGICAELPHILERYPQAPITGPIIRSIGEFCESDSVGEYSTNYLCQDLEHFTSFPYLSSALANDLTEFCNPDSPILSRE